MADSTPDSRYWNQDVTTLAASLGAGWGGLTTDWAASQLAAVGPNSVEDAPRLSVLRLLLRQFESPLVLILVFAAAVSLFLQQWMDAGIILAIVPGDVIFLSAGNLIPADGIILEAQNPANSLCAAGYPDLVSRPERQDKGLIEIKDPYRFRGISAAATLGQHNEQRSDRPSPALPPGPLHRAGLPLNLVRYS